MSQFEKEVVQAILIADNNVEHFRPMSDNETIALIPLVNVTILDYALEALNRSGIEEVFVYASVQVQKVREHIKRGVASLCSWSVNMLVHVIGGEGCRCLGDAMRDLDAKALIRGNFILLGADTITNADLRPIIEQHKKTVKYDKGAAATLIFKEAETRLRSGNEIMVAIDRHNNRLHHHQRLRLNSKETHFEVPLEVFINNSQIALLHNLIDPQMAIGSPSMLSLFSDNFDFESRDDFVRGILINEEILDSRIYVSLLPREQYARKVSNWLAYQIVSLDIINRWTYPLVPDMGIHCLTQQYMFLRNNIYKSSKANVTKAALQENVVIQAASIVETGTTVSHSVIGANCKIGPDCRLSNVFLMDNITIEEGCNLSFCVVGSGAVVGSQSVLANGTVVGPDSIVPEKSQLLNVLVKCVPTADKDIVLKKLGSKAFIVNDKMVSTIDVSDSEDDEPVTTGIPKVAKYAMTYDDSEYYSSGDENESQSATPAPDDTNIFLSEVVDSLSRGFLEKSNPDFLILEINSSRYAYNMSLKEVNFYVVKALFSLQHIKDPINKNILVAVNSVLNQLGPVLLNYIKTEDAMIECLKALEDICEENSYLREKISQIVHYLYDKDFLTEDAIVAWYEQIDTEGNESLKNNLKKLIDWLDQSSDEDDEGSN